ncbi:Myelin regulatory factor-like isoform X3 [Oopsacas minuta]|uniref:Myelin regulatory factor-like isoform X3 n=1 Tax=Oopsacas minuta TaxID=111878 RepID=A0AAV7KLE7_9METZ|nr:Myelin regulatory factor-like isoform X3 [Oopsacas minuta]
MSSLSYQSSHEGSAHNLVSYASQEHLVHHSGLQGPISHNPMSSSVSVDNISWGNGNISQFHQYVGQPNVVVRPNTEYTGRPLENTGRSVSSESAFQSRRSPGSSCSDYSVFSNPNLQFDSTTQLFNLPMANFSTQNTLSYTSALNTTAMVEADSCSTTSPLKSSSMPGLDRASLAPFTPGLPLSSIHKRYDIAEEENDVGPPIGVLQGSPGHANSPSDVYTHDSTPLPQRRAFSNSLVKDSLIQYRNLQGSPFMGANGQLLDNRMTTLTIEDRNMYGLGKAPPVLAEVDEDTQLLYSSQQPSCNDPDNHTSLKSGERPQKKRKHGTFFSSSMSKSTPNLGKRGEKGDHKKNSLSGSCASGNQKKKSLFEKSKLDSHHNNDTRPVDAITDMYTYTPAYMNVYPESPAICSMGMTMSNSYGGLSEISPSSNNSCSEVGNNGSGNDSTLKGFNRTPSHPATIATAGMSGYDPAYMMSTYPLSDLKPDPDELEQGIPQMELEASLSGIDNSGSATLTREPNYDYQALKWSVFAPETFSILYGENETDIADITEFKVVADKGFHFSFTDEAFICQKKNHFQVSVTMCFDKKPRYIQAEAGRPLEKISKFSLHLYGMRLESMSTQVTLDKSQPDRSKIPFDPVEIDPPYQKSKKITIGKLHFSETTANNMRKKGKPNPDQRFFCLFVSLRVLTENHNHYTAVVHKSDKIIVRASNPSQFENDIDYMWTRCNSPDAIYHSGRVGVNTDHPDEALVVYGNLKLSGQLLKPSDRRYKELFRTVKSEEQLESVSKLKIYDYKYTKQYREKHGMNEDICERGFIAQEVKDILPSAVHEITEDKDTTSPYLAINKDYLYIETVGAVQELNRKTKHFQKRLEQIEDSYISPKRRSLSSKLAVSCFASSGFRYILISLIFVQLLLQVFTFFIFFKNGIS